MFGPSAKWRCLFLAFLLFCPTGARARSHNFLTGTPFGLGLLGGLENRPRTGFATGSQTSSSNFSSYFALEPFLDLVNVSFRIHFGWHFYPSFNGKGIDSNGSFTESSSSGSLAMGGRVILSPFLSSGGDKRFYLALGVINSTVRVKNSRKYTSGSLFNQVNTEELSEIGRAHV
mgnify:FL=1